MKSTLTASDFAIHTIGGEHIITRAGVPLSNETAIASYATIQAARDALDLAVLSGSPVSYLMGF